MEPMTASSFLNETKKQKLDMSAWRQGREAGSGQVDRDKVQETSGLKIPGCLEAIGTSDRGQI